MRAWGPTSLRGRLTWRMVLMQAVVLLAFTGAAAIPIIRLISSEQGLDDRVINDIAASVTRNAAGGLDLTPNDALKRLAANYPAFWFYAVDIDSAPVQMGNVPSGIEPMLRGLTRLNSANIADIGMGGSSVAIVRRHDSAAGPLWILTAGGPQIGAKSIVGAFANPIFVGLLFVFTVVSFLYIPVIVTRQLRGVDHIAAEADTIDVDQRGVRLSSAHVPDELHPLVRAVNSALQRLDDGMERRQRFLADAAHELRTPIAILYTRVELLPDDEQRSRLMLDVARLGNLANQLLDLQRLDANSTVFQPVNLVELAAQVTADMAPLAIAAGDDISFDAEIDTVTVAADPASLSRAIVNLIQNAVIHGGKKTAIHVAVGRDGSLRVANTGPGIAEEHRSTIFEPFNRIVPLDQGAGLGLNLVRDIVARHHGHITVGDAPGGGALFEISLPLAASRPR
ncbi:MAG: sensor histidine kinase [Devosia sp.]|uniref:sensor histidine kinase n=1 Tax=Devosia sp. TaxID=1871048 RepID=UPI00262223AE|nr:HAMP domain-containing sensor histidine kinase [Devosia sp.]MDB5585715.1 sensor histidine kinase [Devosia sp.]